MQYSENVQKYPVPPTAPPPPHDQPQQFPQPIYGQPQQFPPPTYGQPQQFPPPTYGQPHQFPPPPYGQPLQLPVPVHIHVNPSQPWSTGLCDCFNDVGLCCLTCWCPCITFGRIADIVDKGSPPCALSGTLYCLVALVTGCQCCYSCCYREKMRSQLMLHVQPCNDCVVHCFCELCALCQEYRELKNRGFDMSHGWNGNAARQNQVVTVAPVVQGGMNR